MRGPGSRSEDGLCLGLRFGRWRRAHIPAVVEACADWEELAPYGAPYGAPDWRPRSRQRNQRRIAATAGPSLASEYSLVIVEDGVLIGECSIHAIDWRNRVGEVAVCIWRPAHRGHGRGHDCLRQAMSWATGYLRAASAGGEGP